MPRRSSSACMVAGARAELHERAKRSPVAPDGGASWSARASRIWWMVGTAEYQVARVARAHRLPVERVRALIAAHTEGRLLQVLGEPRVNVLELNLAVDALK